jgi:hypothetical protein
MSFIFVNAEGEKLSPKDIVELGSNLANNQEVTLRVRNNGASDALEPVIFLMPSADLGEVKYPAKVPPYTDYNDLLLWGNTLNEAGENTAGLYFVDVLQNKTYFSLSSGSNYKNGIPLNTLIEKDGQVDLILGFTPKDGDNTRRLYVGVEVYDPRTNI